MATKMQRAFDFRVKEFGERGTFSGYASVFDVIDSYREVVMPGAFAATLETWKQREALPPLLYQHNSREPIGVFTLMREDEKGLYVEGELLVDDIQRAREVHALLKRKGIRGMSIGFDVDEESYDSRAGILSLKTVDLWEVSIVTFPANQAANVESVKSRDQLADALHVRAFAAGLAVRARLAATATEFSELVK